jgi:hypothetical protein
MKKLRSNSGAFLLQSVEMVSMARLGLTLLCMLMACSPAPVDGRDRRQAQE